MILNTDIPSHPNAHEGILCQEEDDFFCWPWDLLANSQLARRCYWSQTIPSFLSDIFTLTCHWIFHEETIQKGHHIPYKKPPKLTTTMMIRSAFQFIFSSKKQCKALHWGLAEGEITFFTAAHMTLCCVFVPQTALISQQCFTYCWPTHSIHQIHRWFTRLTA